MFLTSKTKLIIYYTLEARIAISQSKVNCTILTIIYIIAIHSADANNHITLDIDIIVSTINSFAVFVQYYIDIDSTIFST